MFEIILFLCGMSIMILELAGVRILSPFVGATHVVYTSIIGIVMIALSIGYWIGGKISAYKPDNFKLSIIITFAGIYILLLGTVQFYFLNLWQDTIPIITQTIVDSVVMFFIPSLLLGMVSPYTVQLALNRNSKKENTGKLVGRFYAISTLGSIIGTFLSGFYLIIFFGIDKIFITLSIIMFIVSLLCCLEELISSKQYNKHLIFINLILLVFVILLLSYLFKKPLNVINGSFFYKTTPYNFINLIETKSEQYMNKPVILSCNYQYCQSAIYKDYKPENFVFDYIAKFYQIFKLKEQKQKILLLGNATGTNLTEMLHYSDKNKLKNIKFDVVEIDKGYTEVGIQYFHLPNNDKRVKFFHEDARTYLNKNNVKYDIVFFDIYTDSFVFPHYLVTKEAVKHIGRALNDNGLLVVNIIASKGNNNKKSYLNQIYTQIASVFPYVVFYCAEDYDDNIDMGNFVLAASFSEEIINNMNSQIKANEYKNVQKNSIVYTDMYSPIEKFSL